MKTILASLLLTLTINKAHACQAEAQVLGVVSKVTFNQNNCRVFLKTSYYQSSNFCHLSIGQIDSQGITFNGECPKIGEEISGVVYEYNNNLYLK